MTLFVNPMQVTRPSSLGLVGIVPDEQFAPTEDLSRYPRTLQRDLEQLSTLLPPDGASGAPGAETPGPSTSTLDASHSALTAMTESAVAPTDPSPLVVFAPATDEMYPMRGELQDLSNHRGVGVEMRGLGDVMEGASRRALRITAGAVCSSPGSAVLQRRRDGLHEALQRRRGGWEGRSTVPPG